MCVLRTGWGCDVLGIIAGAFCVCGLIVGTGYGKRGLCIVTECVRGRDLCKVVFVGSASGS